MAIVGIFLLAIFISGLVIYIWKKEPAGPLIACTLIIGLLLTPILVSVVRLISLFLSGGAF